MPDPDTAFALRKITSAASAAIAHEALQLASARRKKLAVIHKANVLKLGRIVSAGGALGGDGL